MDMLIGRGNELSYECINCAGCYHLLFSQNCSQCIDSSLLFNCRGCKNCFGCTNLIQKEFHLWNKPCSPDEYKDAMAKLSSTTSLENVKSEFAKVRQSSIHRATNNINSEHCTGNYITDSKNCTGCFEVTGAEDCKLTMCARFCRDSYDIFGFAYDSELLYEDVAVGQGIVTAFCFTSESCPNSYYCLYCRNIQNCFACVGVRNKQYCILNKQYSKEEYEERMPKIIDHMRKTGEWGEFFSEKMSPFGYNETVAQDYMPLSEQEVNDRGWHWNTYVPPPAHAKRKIPGSKLPDSIDSVPDDILNWAIECEATRREFKIVKQELDFYRSNHLPVPHFHPDERHKRRMALQNPAQLWDRPCAKCKKTMSTSCAPERPETVYCEECYLKEVY